MGLSGCQIDRVMEILAAEPLAAETELLAILDVGKVFHRVAPWSETKTEQNAKPVRCKGLALRPVIARESQRPFRRRGKCECCTQLNGCNKGLCSERLPARKAYNRQQSETKFQAAEGKAALLFLLGLFNRTAYRSKPLWLNNLT